MSVSRDACRDVPAQPDAYRAGPLVPLTLRIGVTGHRPAKLESVDSELLCQRVRRVLDDLHHELSKLNQAEESKWLYDTAVAEPVIRVISGLAEGADRILVDRRALGVEFDFDLIAALPFPRNEYERDFSDGGSGPEALEEFGRFMDMADTVVELGGQREEGDRAYERLGEFIVRHSDVLIAIWNPQEKNPGRGGTRDVMHRATVEGLTVICIDARPPHEISIFHGRELSPKAPGSPPTPYSSEHLAVLLRRQLSFSEFLEAPGNSDNDADRLAAVRHRFHDFVSERGFSVKAGSASDYVGNGPLILERRRPFLWGSVYRTLVRLLGPSRGAPATNGGQLKSDPVEAETGVAPLPAGVRRTALDRIFAAFLRTDQLAVYYSHLHRSIFMSIYICGGLALCAAAAALYFRERPIAGLEAQYAFALVEFVLLAVVFLLWRTDHRRRYHDRWIEYRSIAEFLRPMIHLSLIGRAYPLNRLREQQEQVGRERVGHGGAARGWAFIYVETVLRWAGIPNVRMDPAGEHLRQCRKFFAANWFGPQLNYHRTNAAQAYAIGNKLQWFSQSMFWGAALMVVVKLLNGFYFHSASLGVVGLLAAVFPALGTIAFAVRNHAEFEISAQRSTSMSIRFRRWKERLQRRADPSDVDALGDLLDEVSESAIREASDWGEIFEVKVSETA